MKGMEISTGVPNLYIQRKKHLFDPGENDGRINGYIQKSH
jgi:hypothetical protein